MRWQDYLALKSEYPKLAVSIQNLMERWGDGPFVVYEVNERGAFQSDPEFWVTTMAGLHMGVYDDGEPSFSLSTMQKDEFLTAVYRSRKAKEE